MKRYIVFAISFILLFSLFNILSGVILTAMYTPDIEEAWNSVDTGVVIESTHNNPFIFTLIIALLSATIAYFIPKKLIKNNNNIN